MGDMKYVYKEHFKNRLELFTYRIDFKRIVVMVLVGLVVAFFEYNRSYNYFFTLLLTVLFSFIVIHRLITSFKEFNTEIHLSARRLVLKNKSKETVFLDNDFVRAIYVIETKELVLVKKNNILSDINFYKIEKEKAAEIVELVCPNKVFIVRESRMGRATT